MFIRRLIGGISMLVLLAAAYALATGRFRAEPKPTVVTTQPKQEAPVSVPALVQRIAGSVERRSSERSAWRPLAAGDRVAADDALRTGENANAELVIGKGTRLELTESSEFRIDQLSEHLSRVKLAGGRMHARVEPGTDTRLRVEVKDSDAVVETQAGDFALLRAADAQVTVATRGGAVDVTAQQQRVRVAEGEQAVVSVGQPPSAPSRIPTSLFLKISRPGPRRLNKLSTQIAGETAPGAALSLNGQPVSVRADGTFSAEVPLVEGKNELSVSAHDVLGRTEQQTLPAITVDTKAPSLKGRVVW